MQTLEYWLCEDCTQAAVNDDYTALDMLDADQARERMSAIQGGLENLGRITSHGDLREEFSSKRCDCCETSLAGFRELFVKIV